MNRKAHTAYNFNCLIGTEGRRKVAGTTDYEPLRITVFHLQ